MSSWSRRNDLYCYVFVCGICFVHLSMPSSSSSPLLSLVSIVKFFVVHSLHTPFDSHPYGTLLSLHRRFSEDLNLAYKKEQGAKLHSQNAERTAVIFVMICNMRWVNVKYSWKNFPFFFAGGNVLYAHFFLHLKWALLNSVYARREWKEANESYNKWDAYTRRQHFLLNNYWPEHIKSR